MIFKPDRGVNMSFFKRIFGGKEIKAAFGLLDEANLTLNNQEFNLVRSKIEEVLKKHPDDIVKLFNSGTPPRQWAYSSIANVAGDLLETGQFHMYRGTLNPMGPGPNLLKLFDSALDELVKMGAIDLSTAETEKKALRDNMKGVG